MSDTTRKPFSTTIGLLRRTTPFLVLNAAVYTAFFLAIVAWLGVFGGLAVYFAERVEVLAFVFLLLAIFGPGGLLMFARRYLLYLMQGAHIAVATTLLLHGSLPEGQSQIAYGREMVKTRFRDVSILFALDRLIHGIVARFTRRFVRIVDMLPLGGGASNVARIGASIINRSLSYIDEAILSYAIARESDNVWQSGRHGVILYAQAYKPILGAAVKIWLLGRVIFVAVLVIVALPAVPLAMAIDGVGFQVAVAIGALLLASLIVRAVFEPFAAIYTLVTYHRAIEGLAVNAVWDQRLQSVSKKFQELVGKAQQAASEPDPLDTTPVPPAALDAGHDQRNGSLPPQTAAAPTQPPGGGAPSFAAMSRGGRGGLGGLIGGAVAQAADGFAQAQRQRANGAPPTTAADGRTPTPTQGSGHAGAQEDDQDREDRQDAGPGPAAAMPPPPPSPDRAPPSPPPPPPPPPAS